MYAAPGVPEIVKFTLHPAIRWGQPAVDQCPNTTFSCPDEDCGCPFTKWAVCGLHATNTTQDEQVNFLTCFDQNDIAFSDEWVDAGEMPPPNTSALSCINQTAEPARYAAVKACGEGNLSAKLLEDARAYFAETFPMYTTGPRFDVPHVYINNEEQDVNLPGNVWTYIKTLCNKGIGANVCKALESSSLRTSVGRSKNFGRTKKRSGRLVQV